jgi:hypothetical protein
MTTRAVISAISSPCCRYMSEKVEVFEGASKEREIEGSQGGIC